MYLHMMAESIDHGPCQVGLCGQANKQVSKRFELGDWRKGGGGGEVGEKGGGSFHLPGCQLIPELLPLSSSKGAVGTLSDCHSSLQLVDPSF